MQAAAAQKAGGAELTYLGDGIAFNGASQMRVDIGKEAGPAIGKLLDNQVKGEPVRTIPATIHAISRQY